MPSLSAFVQSFPRCLRHPGRLCVAAVLASLVFAAACDKSDPIGPSPVTGTTAATFSVSGTVSDAHAGGAALAGAQVDVIDGAGVSHSASTDPSGHYQVAALPAGTYAIRVSAGGYVTQTQPLTLSGDQVVSFSLSAAASGSAPLALTGQVTIAGGANAPLSGARLDITAGANSGRSATTDGNGNYELNNLVAGSFTVQVSAAGYATKTADVTLTTTETVSFSLAAAAPAPPQTYTLSGAVFDSTSGGNIGVAAARVDITAGANSGQSATADDSGRYQLTALAPGSFTVRASAPGYLPQTSSVTLSANQTANFTLAPTMTASGRVVDALSHAGLAGIAISGSSLGQATSDTSGGFAVGAKPGASDPIQIVFTGAAIVEHRTQLHVPCANELVNLIPASFDLRAFDEMFRAPSLRRWLSAPPLFIERRTVQFTSTTAAQGTTVSDAMSDADYASLVNDFTWALPQLTGGAYTGFANVSQTASAPGATVLLLNTGQITVVRVSGLTAATGFWGYGRYFTTSDGTVIGGLVMLDRDFETTGSSYLRSLHAHELGHALGYNHVTVRTSVMNADARTEPTPFDTDAARIAFDRQPGNTSPDVDAGAAGAAPQGRTTGTWNAGAR